MMGKFTWLKILVAIVGLAAFGALIWFAGPLLAVGDARPFENPSIRAITMVVAMAGAAVYFIVDLVNRGRQTAALARGLGVEAAGSNGANTGAEDAVKDDSETLKGRMSDALITLRKTGASKGDPLYDLPWYVIIGPPGSGKTTALVNSGLKFPLATGGLTPAAVAGQGGTRYCDWWFTEDAVLIDTAGRYTTQDSDARADKASWLSFLDLLRSNRPRQPINGVFVCISIHDLLSLSEAQRREHADAIRARLKELYDELKINFPVYALFTKCDLIAGFMEFFGAMNAQERRAVWGVTFQTSDKNANMVSQVGPEFDLLIERLNDMVIDRIQDEPTPQAKVLIFGFPSQMAVLKAAVAEFLGQIFEPTRYHANATLRGFYFTSGTQEGTPVDQLVGALSRSFGVQNLGSAHYSGSGKSFFLTDLLQRVVFDEAGWVSTNIKAVRRTMALKGLGYGLLGLVVVLGGVWMWLSYRFNTELIAKTFASVTQYKQIAGPLNDQATIVDADLSRVHTALHHLRNMPAGYATRNEATPLQGRAGLDQEPRLNASAETAYESGLQRLMRPRLMFRLEDTMRRSLTNPPALVEPLQIYMLVAGREPMDRHAVIDYFRRDLEQLFAGAGNANGRKALLEHVTHLVTLDQPVGVNALDIDSGLVQEVQSTIARMTISDRAFELLRSAAMKASGQDWVAGKKGGQDVARVFTAANGADLDEVRVPYFYTNDGFHDAFLAKIPEITARVKQERKVLGDMNAQEAIRSQYEALPRRLSDRYSREYINAWTAALGQLRIRSLTADKPRYLALEAAASPTSPITQLIESVRDETALTRARPQKEGAAKPAAPPDQPSLILPGGEVPGAQVEAAFRSYALLLEGERSRRPVDELNRVLNEVYTSLNLINDPVRSAEGRQKFSDSLRSLETTTGRFPEPFKAMLRDAAASFDSDATGTTVARLNQGVTEQVTPACQKATSGVYPFVRTSPRDMSFPDFQQMFGPNGTIDRFFQTNLAQYALTGGPSWSWSQTSAIGRQLSQTMLQQFQQANEIKQAFFPGGSTGFSFAVKHLSMSEDIDIARLEINTGQLVIEKPRAPGFSLFGSPPPKAPQNVATTFQWPGPVNMGAASVSLLPELPQIANQLKKEGPWAIFRLLDQVSISGSRDQQVARISVGGRLVTYQINPVTLPNPFTLVALQRFACPSPR
jgi:type VI secretion system protein ImpL